MTTKRSKPLTYAASGVNVDEGNRLVSLIKPAVRSTARAEVIGGIGGFGGLFSARFKGLKDPVLVSATDGVGTKLMVAFMADRHDTVGVDLVAMSVNDIVVSGAEPLFFLDYFATGALSAEKAADVVRGVARGCKEAGCALIGGETAEMPGLYGAGEYDLAGFAVGVVDRKKIIDGSSIKEGDRLIGLASTGLHSNGYSLARKVLFERMRLNPTSKPAGLGTDVGTALLKPTRIYVKPVLEVIKKHKIGGIVHVTGGGFQENIPRVLPEGLGAVIEMGSWKIPPIFGLIQEGGSIAEAEMLRTFNCGVGMILAVRPALEEKVIEAFGAMKPKVQAWGIGTVVKTKRGANRVEFE